MNLVWEAMRGEGFDRWWMRVGGAVQKVSFVFAFLVLLKKMTARVQPKISSCRFDVNQEN